MPICQTRSTTTRIRDMASTGTASRKMKLVAYIVQTKIGNRNQVQSGGTQPMDRDDEVQSGQQR